MRLFHRASFALSILLFLTITSAAQSGKFTVQIVAAPNQTEAEETAKQLRAQGVSAYVLKSQVPGKGTFYRVRAGSFANANEARKYGESLKQQGVVPEFFIAPYEAPRESGSAEKSPVKPSVVPDRIEAKIEPAPKESSKKEPSKEAAKNSKAPEPVTAPIKESAATASTATSPSAAPSGTPVSFTQFRNQQIGFTFEYPAHWTGNPLTSDDAQAQRVNAGAYFQSADDNAFLHVIWNELEKANNPANNNDLIVDVILNSMKSGKETQTMEATSRRVEEAKGQIKTYLDLKASFMLPGQTSPLDFLGKALIVRANKGILLTAVFFSKEAPANVSGLADKVIASVKIPE